MAPATVVIIIIGDEILKGQVQDTNSYYLAGQLRTRGFVVQRILTVPDDVQAIADAVATGSSQSDFVITAGGIGPTHDDVTYEGVAAAFKVQLAHHSEMDQAMRRVVGCEDIGKIAMIPRTAQLVSLRSSGELPEIPVASVNNVYILSGIPSYCQAGFPPVLDDMDAVKPVYEPIFTQSVIIKADEIRMLNQINNVIQRFNNRVSVGSYPYETPERTWHTKVTLESMNVIDLSEARESLLSSVPPGLVDSSLTEEDVNRVYNLAHGCSSFSKIVSFAIGIIEKALESYEEVILSFNGGKDCTALLHLLWAVYSRNKKGKINILYIASEDTFPEITEFIDACVSRYGLVLHSRPGPLKPALEAFKREYPKITAVWLGSRRTDPVGQEQHFAPCDPDWPPLMRVSPILNFDYDDIWRFLRYLSVPYCSLYDQGYTSLGNRSNTRPNAALLDPVTNTYHPAYRLRDCDSERSGRR